MSSDEVALDVATANDAPVLSNLLELYCHDLSELFSLKVGVDGRFGYDRLSLYWSELDKRFAFLIRAGSHLAGFALVTRGSPATDDPNDLDMAEFFVLRAHRRSGIGRRAAFLLWNRLPGQWVVRVAEANQTGVPFWETAIAEYTRGSYSSKEHISNARVFQVFSFKTSTTGAPQ